MAQDNLHGIQLRITTLARSEKRVLHVYARTGQLDRLHLAGLRGEKAGLRIRLRALRRTRTAAQRAARKRGR